MRWVCIRIDVLGFHGINAPTAQRVWSTRMSWCVPNQFINWLLPNTALPAVPVSPNQFIPGVLVFSSLIVRFEFFSLGDRLARQFPLPIFICGSLISLRNLNVECNRQRGLDFRRDPAPCDAGTGVYWACAGEPSARRPWLGGAGHGHQYHRWPISVVNPLY